MSDDSTAESSAEIRKRVNTARIRQKNRYKEVLGCLTNSMMPTSMIEDFCEIDSGSRKLLEISVEKLGLSARAYHRILKLARTIADLEGVDNIEKRHIAEAVQYRRLG